MIRVPPPSKGWLYHAGWGRKTMGYLRREVQEAVAGAHGWQAARKASQQGERKIGLPEYAVRLLGPHP